MSRYTRREFLFAGGGSLFAFNVPFLRAATSEETVQPQINHGLGERRTYRVCHRVTVDLGTLPFSLLEIWLPLPLVDALICPEQSVNLLQLQPTAKISCDSKHLARVATCAFGSQEASRFPREYSLQASYNVTIHNRRFDLELQRQYSGTITEEEKRYYKDAQYRLFTRSEKKAPASHASIKALARRIKNGDQSPYETAHSFYDWIIDNIEYKTTGRFGGAVVCLRDRCGECSDFSALFVALCRAVGIPARPIVGYCADRSNNWHCWAEFMLPNKRWLPVDCQMGSSGIFGRYRHFGRSANCCVALCKTFDVTLVNPDGHNHKAAYLQNGRWWWRSDQKLPKSLRPTGTFEVHCEQI